MEIKVIKENEKNSERFNALWNGTLFVYEKYTYIKVSDFLAFNCYSKEIEVFTSNELVHLANGYAVFHEGIELL